MNHFGNLFCRALDNVTIYARCQGSEALLGPLFRYGASRVRKSSFSQVPSGFISFGVDYFFNGTPTAQM
jgi:hypothetical protein